MKLLSLVVLILCSLGCAQWNDTVGSYAGLDVELGYNRNFGDNDIMGTSIDGQGQGKGHSSGMWSGHAFSTDVFKTNFRILFRPSDQR